MCVGCMKLNSLETTKEKKSKANNKTANINVKKTFSLKQGLRSWWPELLAVYRQLTITMRRKIYCHSGDTNYTKDNNDIR